MNMCIVNEIVFNVLYNIRIVRVITIFKYGMSLF
jgi:hypothetical protein